eukprot:jgi/Psemu1/327832/estExt_fgenesh1_pg.C_8430001
MYVVPIVVPPEAIVEVINPFADIDDVDVDEDDSEDEDEESGIGANQRETLSYHNIFQRQNQQQLPSLSERHGRHLVASSSGNLTALVVRIVAQNGTEPTDSLETTRNNVFGDDVCLKSQFAACSKDQLIIEPFEGNTTTGVPVHGGVINVRVDLNPSGSNKKKFLKRSNFAANEQLGNLEEQFDLVLFCIPPGTGDYWKAEANLRRWDSYYNDKWCGYVSAQMHEVGHSGEGELRNDGSSEYADQSGLMGLSYQGDDSPRMCFNVAKNYQLNWYKRQRKRIDPTRATDKTIADSISIKQNFIMNGIDDYMVTGNTEGKVVALRLTQRGSPKDYYIGYNRAKGANNETQEDANEIVILEKATGGPDGSTMSWKLASLRYQGQRYVIPEFGLESSFVEIKLWSNTIKDSTTNDSNKDVAIAVTSFKAAKPCLHRKKDWVPFVIEGKTDQYGHETWWSIKIDHPDGGYVDFGSGYKGNQEFEAALDLCPGECYVFEINDLWGDGICGGTSCDAGEGFFRGTLNGEQIFSGAKFGFTEKFQFCTEEAGNRKSESAMCKDSKQFRYLDKQRKDCDWVGRRRTKKRCFKTWKEKKVYRWCPSACNLCD